MKLVKFYFTYNSRPDEKSFVLINDFDYHDVVRDYEVLHDDLAFKNPYGFFEFLIEQNYIKEVETCKPVFLMQPELCDNNFIYY